MQRGEAAGMLRINNDSIFPICQANDAANRWFFSNSPVESLFLCFLWLGPAAPAALRRPAGRLSVARAQITSISGGRPQRPTTPQVSEGVPMGMQSCPNLAPKSPGNPTRRISTPHPGISQGYPRDISKHILSIPSFPCIRFWPFRCVGISLGYHFISLG